MGQSWKQGIDYEPINTKRISRRSDLELDELLDKPTKT